MPVGRIDKILAGIFERRAVLASGPTIQQPMTMSKAHWQQKKAGGRKYLPKRPPPKWVAALKTPKTQRRRRQIKPKMEDKENGSPDPYSSEQPFEEGRDRNWSEEGEMEWFPHPAYSRKEGEGGNDEMAEQWKPMEEEEEDWPGEPQREGEWEEYQEPDMEQNDEE